MKSFDSLAKFASHLERNVDAKYLIRREECLEFLGVALEASVKKKIGTLQNEWEPLADSTKKDKARLGYGSPPDYNPLLRTGEMRDSIHHEVTLNVLSVGSDDQIAEYQELGTIRIPARSFLALTFFKEKKNIEFVLMTFLVAWISGVNPEYKRKKLLNLS